MSRRETIPFHVSSEAATEKGSGCFEIPLDPPLDVGHTAHPTVYLNNLSFTNTFANIDKDRYDNADLALSVSQYHDDIIHTTSVQTAGAGYDNGTYTDVPTTGGSGSGATLDLTISSGSIIAHAINKVEWSLHCR
jgi:hypothetical protein